VSDIANLLEFSKSLNALYVEDDSAILENYAKVFKEFFASLQTAQDGQEGLEKYKDGSFDLVITDINMPRMDGIEMIGHILKENPEQTIIVTSAHDESDYLLKLIDLGIEKFLIKPVDFSKMLNVLMRTCKNIYEVKEFKEYQSRIETENLVSAGLVKELHKKNDELENVIYQLTRNQNVNITLVDGIEKEKEFSHNELEFYAPEVDSQSAKDFVETFAGDLDTFNDHLESIEETLELLIHQKLLDPNDQSAQELAIAFNDYGQHIASLYKFNNLAQGLKNFAAVLAQVNDPELLKEMKTFLFGIADSLNKWRSEVLIKQSAKDIHFLDSSIISDCMQTESLLSQESHEDDNIDDLLF